MKKIERDVSRKEEIGSTKEAGATEPKQTFDALEKEHSLIAAILGAAKDLLVVVLDREGRITQFNQVCEQLTGYSAEEVKGRRPWDFLSLPEEVQEMKETFNHVLAGTPSQTESHLITKDGRRLVIAWSSCAATSRGL